MRKGKDAVSYTHLKGIGAVILAGAVAVSAAPTAYCNDTGTEPIERPGWTLVFQEEFNDAVLNPAKFSDSYMPCLLYTSRCV